ncbi:MAG: hypothetical protein U0836_03920 [Pirellulales bacterium]
MRAFLATTILAVAASAVGCDSATAPPAPRRGVNPGAFGVAIDEAPPPPPPVTTQTPPPAPAAPAEPAREKAQAGVGIKGRSLQGGGYLSATFAAKFQIEQKLVFDQITHAMNLYEAEHGEKPKSHDEFMQKIIGFNQIQLPKLPEGDRYVYDPQRGELMVEHPVEQP